MSKNEMTICSKDVPPQMDPLRRRHQANKQKKIDKYFDNECQLDLPMTCSTTVYLVAESA